MTLDTVVTAEAPEGIELVLRPAGIVARTYAFLIDALIRGTILLIASIALGSMNRLGGALFLILLFLIEWLYPVLFELLPGSATPGKRARPTRRSRPARASTARVPAHAALPPESRRAAVCCPCVLRACRRRGRRCV